MNPRRLTLSTFEFTVAFPSPAQAPSFRNLVSSGAFCLQLPWSDACRNSCRHNHSRTHHRPCMPHCRCQHRQLGSLVHFLWLREPCVIHAELRRCNPVRVRLAQPVQCMQRVLHSVRLIQFAQHPSSMCWHNCSQCQRHCFALRRQLDLPIWILL